MNDIEYMYRQDIREKKAAGRGAFSKKSGARTKYVGLTQDRLTTAQLKRRNSPVYTYNITTCIHSWSEFKSMPSDLQRTYITNVLATFNPSLAALGLTMNVSGETLRQYLKAQGIELNLKRGGRKREHPSWRAFTCDNVTTTGQMVKPSETNVVAPEPAPEEEPAPVVESCGIEDCIPDRFDAPSNVYKFSVSMEGTAMQLYTMLAMLTDSKERYEFELVVKSKGGDS